MKKKKLAKKNTLLKKYLWWVKEEKISDTIPEQKIIAYVLNFADYEDTKKLLPLFSKKDIRQSIASPIPGVWSKKSLNFWRTYLKKI